MGVVQKRVLKEGGYEVGKELLPAYFTPPDHICSFNLFSPSRHLLKLETILQRENTSCVTCELNTCHKRSETDEPKKKA